MFNFDFKNSYRQLPQAFYDESLPTSAISPKLVAFNWDLARFLKLEPDFQSQQSSKDLGSVEHPPVPEDHPTQGHRPPTESALNKQLSNILSGKEIVPGTSPIAMAYAGHQFGHFVPQLGDGRAHLLGELQALDGQLYDVHLKGSGATKFSRQGDGRSALGPVLKEYIVSEGLFRLGVPTSRILSATLTGEEVHREAALPGAISARIAKSHIRVGTFEYFMARGDVENLTVLLNYAIQRHDADLLYQTNDVSEKALEFFRRTSRRKLDLVAQWMAFGFIHGVMNTDNTTVSGETVDFGPCAFMDNFKLNKVFSSIDHQGRYSYGNQGNIALWNLSCLAQCLIPLVDNESEGAIRKLESELEPLPSYFESSFLGLMMKKLGILNSKPEDTHLINIFFEHLETNNLDFTTFFRELAQPKMWDTKIRAIEQWKVRLNSENLDPKDVAPMMNTINPALIPRNHQVEAAINKAYNNDYEHFFNLLEALKDPYQEDAKFSEFRRPPNPEEEVKQTFCGT